MANAFFPDKALIAIGKEGDSGSEIDITTQVSSFSESGFGRDITSDPYFGDAKVKIKKSQEDGEISFDIAITDEQWDRMFWGGTGSDFTSGSSQSDYRVTVTFIDGGSLVPLSTEAGSASGAFDGGTTNNMYRKVYAECNVTAFEPAASADEYLKGTITFKVPPTDASASGNVRVQKFTAGSSTEMTALGSYTSTAKW